MRLPCVPTSGRKRPRRRKDAARLLPCVPTRGGNACASGRTLPAPGTHTSLLPTGRLPGTAPRRGEAPQKPRSGTEQRRSVPGGRRSRLGPRRKLPLDAGETVPYRPEASSLGTGTRRGAGWLRGRVALGGRGAKPPTHRCTSGRPSGGRTSGGSRTWGPRPCPRSCAGSLRFHSYRLLVRPEEHMRVYKQNDNKND